MFFVYYKWNQSAMSASAEISGMFSDKCCCSDKRVQVNTCSTALLKWDGNKALIT